MAGDVTFDSDAIEPEDGYTWEETERAAWDVHVDESQKEWISSIVEQVKGAGDWNEHDADVWTR